MDTWDSAKILYDTLERSLKENTLTYQDYVHLMKRVKDVVEEPLVINDFDRLVSVFHPEWLTFGTKYTELAHIDSVTRVKKAAKDTARAKTGSKDKKVPRPRKYSPKPITAKELIGVLRSLNQRQESHLARVVARALSGKKIMVSAELGSRLKLHGMVKTSIRPDTTFIIGNKVIPSTRENRQRKHKREQHDSH